MMPLAARLSLSLRASQHVNPIANIAAPSMRIAEIAAGASSGTANKTEITKDGSKANIRPANTSTADFTIRRVFMETSSVRMQLVVADAKAVPKSFVS
jgi:hypothetical protein